AKGAARELENSYIHRSAASQPRYRALRVRRRHEWRDIQGLCRAIPRSDFEERRHRAHGQCERSQGRWRRTGHRSSGCHSILSAGIQSRPDLNPIEQLFAKLKAMLRKIAAYSLKNSAFSIDSLCKAIASCLREISRSECTAFLANSGYGQPNRELPSGLQMLRGARRRILANPIILRESSVRAVGHLAAAPTRL